MGLCLGKPPGAGSASPSSPHWPDLPPEITGLVLSCLASHDDRLSFVAVCRGWRLAAQQHRKLLPPALPCINLGGGAYQSIIDGKVRRFATPSHGRVDASFGGWLLYEHQGSGRRCFLRDPLSPSTPATKVPCRYGRSGNWLDAERRCRDVLAKCDHIGSVFPVEKILMVSPDLVVTMLRSSPFMAAPLNLAYFRPGTPTEISWSPANGTSGFYHVAQEFIYMDIAFHREKIFAVEWKGGLLAHELVVGETVSLGRCEHVIRVHPDDAPVAINTNYHLVTSSDEQKLLMVRWSIPDLLTGTKLGHHSLALHVFEADMDKGRWSEVKDLGNQVLFVGTTGSRAIAVAGSSEHYHQRFRGGNRVFLLGNNWAWVWAHRRDIVAPCNCSDCRKLTNDTPSYCVYDMISGRASLVSLRRGNNSRKYSRSEWFFPSV